MKKYLKNCPDLGKVQNLYGWDGGGNTFEEHPNKPNKNKKNNKKNNLRFFHSPVSYLAGVIDAY